MLTVNMGRRGKRPFYGRKKGRVYGSSLLSANNAVDLSNYDPKTGLQPELSPFFLI